MQKTAASIVGTLALVAAAAFAALMLVPALMGYERYVILTGSMGGTYDPGSIVYAEAVPTQDLRVGDVITYAPPPGSSPTPLVTHRISKVSVRDGERVYRTKGDANEAVDPWKFTLPDETQARVAFSVPYAGRAISALSDRRTRMLLIGVPAGLIALLVLGGLARESAAAARDRRGALAPETSWTRI